MFGPYSNGKKVCRNEFTKNNTRADSPLYLIDSRIVQKQRCFFCSIRLRFAGVRELQCGAMTRSAFHVTYPTHCQTEICGAVIRTAADNGPAFPTTCCPVTLPWLPMLAVQRFRTRVYFTFILGDRMARKTATRSETTMVINEVRA